MTVTNQTNKTRQHGDGITVTFSFSFPIFQSSDLEVYKIDTSVTPEVATLLTITTDYSVNISKTTEGGSVTFVVTPTSDEDVFIKRVLPYTQETDIAINSNFPEKNVENEFDKSRMVDIQNQEETERTLKVNEFYDGLTDFEIANPEAGKVIGYDATGLKMVNYSGSDLDTILTSAYGKQLVQSANALGARNLLDLGASDDVEFNDLTINDIIADSVSTNKLTVDDLLTLTPNSVEIASGEVTYSSPNMKVDVEGGIVSSDDLATINVGDATDGTLLLITLTNDGRNIVIKNGTGNIYNADGVDITLDVRGDNTLLKYNSDVSKWCVVSVKTTNYATVIKTASTSPTIEFDWVNDGYTREITLKAVRPANDGVIGYIRISQDGGSTHKAGANDYKYGTYAHKSSNTESGSGSNGAAFIAINDNDVNFLLGNATTESLGGKIIIEDAGSTALYKKISSNVNYVSESGEAVTCIGSGFYDTDANAIDGIQFLMSAGNIAEGVFILKVIYNNR